jgi:hypothetical protein
MGATGQGRDDGNDRGGQPEVAPNPRAAAPQPDEAAVAETQVNLVSPFAHPRGVEATRFDLRQFMTKHRVPVALSCLALSGALAAVILKRRRRDTWDARIARLRKLFVDATNGAG